MLGFVKTNFYISRIILKINIQSCCVLINGNSLHFPELISARASGAKLSQQITKVVSW
jgi:hypothetical protein